MDKSQNPFEILNVDENSDFNTIRKSYLKLARKYHPDKVTDVDKPHAEAKFRA